MAGVIMTNDRHQRFILGDGHSPKSGMIVSAAFSLLSRTLAPSAVRTGFFEMRRLTEIREIAPLNLWVHPDEER
jgi:hypothetical protein